MPTGARRPASRRRLSSPPGRGWPSGYWSGPGGLGLRLPGSPPDVAYANDVQFRRFLKAHRRPYVLAVVQSDQRLDGGRHRDRGDAIAERLPAKA